MNKITRPFTESTALSDEAELIGTATAGHDDAGLRRPPTLRELAERIAALEARIEMLESMVAAMAVEVRTRRRSSLGSTTGSGSLRKLLADRLDQIGPSGRSAVHDGTRRAPVGLEGPNWFERTGSRS